MALLSVAELDSLERLALATRSRLLGFFAGDHRSRRHGSSLDFADYREYRPGDDFRRIDTALSARLDRLYLKLFEAEEDVPVRIVVDSSASMGFGEPTKMSQATRLAAAFAHLALVRGDRVRIYAASGGGALPSPWFRSKADSFAAMRWLEGRDASGPSGARACVRSIRDEGRPGLIVYVGDLLDIDWEQTVRRLSPPGEAVVVHVLSPADIDPGLEGDLTLVDPETGEEVDIAGTPDILDDYRKRAQTWLEQVRSTCTGRGIAYAMAPSDVPLLDLFLRAFRREQVVR